MRRVFVHEGQAVEQGQVLAEMEGWNLRSGLAEAQAKYETALLQMNQALAGNDGTEAGVHRVQADYWKAEVDRSAANAGESRIARADRRGGGDPTRGEFRGTQIGAGRFVRGGGGHFASGG